MTQSVRDLLDKASESLAAAEVLFRDDYHDYAAGRAYYAMFYALQALFLNRGESFSRHSAVIAAFGKDFVKPGAIEIRFHRSLLRAFDLRNAGDYGSMHTVTQAQARQVIDDAREFIHRITDYLGSQPA